MQFQQLHTNNDPANPYPIVMQPMNYQQRPMYYPQQQQPMNYPMQQPMNYPMQQPMNYPMQQQPMQQPMNYPQSIYYPQQQEQPWSWRRMPKWKKIIIASIISIVLILLLYNYGCSIPIINIICVIGKAIGKILSPIGSLLGL